MCPLFTQTTAFKSVMPLINWFVNEQLVIILPAVCLPVIENLESQITLHDMSHRAVGYAGNFLDFMRTFAGVGLVSLTTFQLGNLRDILLHSDRPWPSIANFSFDWTNFVDFSQKIVDQTDDSFLLTKFKTNSLSSPSFFLHKKFNQTLFFVREWRVS